MALAGGLISPSGRNGRPSSALQMDQAKTDFTQIVDIEFPDISIQNGHVRPFLTYSGNKAVLRPLMFALSISSFGAWNCYHHAF